MKITTSRRLLLHFVLLSISLFQTAQPLYSIEIRKPHEFFLGRSANANQINENFDVLYDALNQINTDENLGLDELVQSHNFFNDQEASSAQINGNFDDLFVRINLMLTDYNQITITKPNQFISGNIVLPVQINENFDVLFSATNSIYISILNNKFDELYARANIWLLKVNQPEITKPNTFDPSIQPNADQVNENFDQLISALNYLLTEFKLPAVSKPFHFVNGEQILSNQVSANFEVLNSASNSILVCFLNKDFDDLYEKVNGWLMVVDQPEIAKPYTLDSSIQPDAGEVNADFDVLYGAVNQLLTGIHYPTVTKPHDFADGAQVDANKVNQNFNVLYSAANELEAYFIEYFNEVIESSIPDTGQTTCYNGAGTVVTCPDPGQPLAQDGSYTINPLSYTDNSDGTVTDNVTGLIWQKTDDNVQRNWYEANSYCNNNTAALPGLRWRLPNIKELISIVDYEGPPPSINSVFTGINIVPNSSHYWSSTNTLRYENFAWNVRFAYGGATVNDINDSARAYVLCVRSEE